MSICESTTFESTSLPFLTTEAAVPSQLVSIPSINMSFSFFLIIPAPLQIYHLSSCQFSDFSCQQGQKIKKHFNNLLSFAFIFILFLSTFYLLLASFHCFLLISQRLYRIELGCLVGGVYSKENANSRRKKPSYHYSAYGYSRRYFYESRYGKRYAYAESGPYYAAHS